MVGFDWHFSGGCVILAVTISKVGGGRELSKVKSAVVLWVPFLACRPIIGFIHTYKRHVNDNRIASNDLKTWGLIVVSYTPYSQKSVGMVNKNYVESWGNSGDCGAKKLRLCGGPRTKISGRGGGSFPIVVHEESPEFYWLDVWTLFSFPIPVVYPVHNRD